MLNNNSFLSAILQRYSSAVVVQLSGFVVGLTVSKILGPELLGYWGVFHIVAGYYSYINLGATNGLTRDLGVALGSNDKEKIKQVIGAAHAVQLTLPFIATVGLFVAGLFFVSPMNWILITAGIYGFIQLYEVTLIRIINSFEQHKLLAILHSVKAILSIIIVIPLVYYFQIEGRFVAAIILSLIIFAATWKILPINLSLNFDRKLIRSLIKVGFPIGMTGFLMTNFFLVDRLVVVNYLAIEQLGLYVFAFYLVMVVKGIKQTVSNILYQRQNIIYGEDGPEKRRRLLIISKSTAYFTTDITGVLSGVLLILFSFAVKYIMPEYTESISLTFIIVFSQVMGSINVLNTVGKHWDNLKLMGISLIINIILSIVFVNIWGLLGVAYATFLAFLIYNTIVNIYNLRYFNVTSMESLGIVIRISGVPIFCYLIAYFIENALLEYITGVLLTDIAIAIFLCLGYLILTAPLLYYLRKHISVLNRIKLLNK